MCYARRVWTVLLRCSEFGSSCCWIISLGMKKVQQSADDQDADSHRLYRNLLVSTSLQNQRLQNFKRRCLHLQSKKKRSTRAQKRFQDNRVSEGRSGFLWVTGNRTQTGNDLWRNQLWHKSNCTSGVIGLNIRNVRKIRCVVYKMFYWKL